MIWRCHTSVVAWLYLYISTIYTHNTHPMCVNVCVYVCMGFPRWLSGKETTCQCRRCKRSGFYPWVGKISWSRKWQPTSVLLPGKSHGRRSLGGCSPWGRKELDTTEWLHFTFVVIDCVVFQLLNCAWLWPHALQHTRLLCPPLSPRVCSNSSPLSQWCYLTISLPPSPFPFNLSQTQDLFQWVGSSHQVAKILELQLQHQSFQWIFRIDFL